MMVDHGTFLVSTTYLTEAMAIDRIAPELRRKAETVFPQAKAMLPKAIAAGGVKIACGSDAPPAIPHGQQAKELVALVNRGMTPMQALRAATITSAELIDEADELGRLAPGGESSRYHRGTRRSLRGHLDDPRRAIRHEGRRGLQTGGSAMKKNGQENLLWLLKQAFHYSGHTVNEAMSKHGVTSAQTGLLRQLADEPGLSGGAELGRRLLISPPGGAQLALATLEKKNGLIERKPDPEHGRIQRAYLTEKGGRRTVTAANADAVAAHDELFSVLTAEERKTLAELLVRIVVQGHGEVSFTLHPDAD